MKQKIKNAKRILNKLQNQKLIGNPQAEAIRHALNGEEAQIFVETLENIENTVATMPRTMETEAKGKKAIAYLHYFVSNWDWHIAELDANADDTNPDTGLPENHCQAFGMAKNSGEPELGYISIPEITAAGAELDLHWEPKAIEELHQNL
jgi:hypothetical protein